MSPKAFNALNLTHSRELFCLHEPTGKYLFVSDAIHALTGYTPDDLLGKNPYDFFHPDDRELIEHTSHRRVLKGDAVATVEYRFRKKDGSYFWLYTETYAILNEQGILQHLFSRSVDVTDRVALRAENLKNQRLFDDVGRMARIGTWEVDIATMTTQWSPMTYTIHEVDTPEVFDVANAIEFYPGAAREHIMRTVQEAIDHGTPFDTTLPFVTAKGNARWVRSMGTAEMRFGRTVRLYGIFQDVTPAMEYQQSLEKMIAELTAQKQQLQEFNRIVSHNVRSPLANQVMLLDLLENSPTEAEKAELLGNLRAVTTSLLELSDNLVRVIESNASLRVQREPVSVGEVLRRVLTLLDAEVKASGACVESDLAAWDRIHYVRIYLESILLNLLSNALKYAHPDRPLRIGVRTDWQDDRPTLTVQDNGRGIDLERYGEKLFKLGQTFHRDVAGKGVGLFMIKTQVEALGGRIAVESHSGEGSTFTVQFAID